MSRRWNVSDPSVNVSRREVLKSGAAAAALMAGANIAHAAEEAAATAPTSQPAAVLPMRQLGKTGVKVTALNAGCGSEFPQRMLDHLYGQGIRYFDTAAGYAKGKSEIALGAWFERTGKRKDIFLVTKDGTDKPEDLLTRVDARLKALQTDYLDLYFLHGLGGAKGVGIIKSPETKKVAEQLKKSGKVKFFGFSTHAKDIPECLTAAAEAGCMDVIMMSYSPITGEAKDGAFNKGLDACHKAGIGLVAMKTLRGMQKAVESKLVELTLHQAVVQAVLSDERIASVCSEMENFKQVDQNTQAVRQMKGPMTGAQLDSLRSHLLAVGYAFCPGCAACRSGILAAHGHLHDVLRYLSYYEQDGKRDEARALYRTLPAEARSMPEFDLAAASRACACGVDYAACLARAQQKLA
jgi:hypothetical protein